MTNTVVTEVKAVKFTKRDRFNQLLELVNAAGGDNAVDLTDFINHEIELLDKKHSKKTGGNSRTAANAEIVFNALAAMDNAVTVTELQKNSPALADFTNQRISACLRILKEEGKVVKTTAKGKSYFSATVRDLGVVTVEDDIVEESSDEDSAAE